MRSAPNSPAWSTRIIASISRAWGGCVPGKAGRVPRVVVRADSLIGFHSDAGATPHRQGKCGGAEREHSIETGQRNSKQAPLRFIAAHDGEVLVASRHIADSGAGVRAGPKLPFNAGVENSNEARDR